MKTSRIACLLLAGLLLACGSSEADWRKADAEGTVAAFQKFLADHPRDAHVPQARARIEALQDQQAWAQVEQGGTVESFQQYETGQKEGLHLAEARDRIADLQRAAAFKVAQSEATPTAVPGFSAEIPAGPGGGPSACAAAEAHRPAADVDLSGAAWGVSQPQGRATRACEAREAICQGPASGCRHTGKCKKPARAREFRADEPRGGASGLRQTEEIPSALQSCEELNGTHRLTVAPCAADESL